MAHVYFIYGAGHDLLYIGLTRQGVKSRLHQHKADGRPWVGKESIVNYMKFNSFEEAQSEEVLAIIRLRPKCNTHYKNRTFNKSRSEPISKGSFVKNGKGKWVSLWEET